MPPTPQKKGTNWGRWSKTLSFWILVILIPVAFIQFSSGRAEQAPPITYTQYDQELQRDNVARVKIQAGRSILGEFKQRVPVNGRDAKKFTVRLPVENSDEELKRLREKSVVIEAEDARPSIGAFLINFLPYFLLIGFWIFLFR